MEKEYKHIPIPDLPIDEQPRYKLSTLGSEFLSNAELFAIIIGTGNKFETAVQLSQRVLKSCDNDLSYFVNATVDELSNAKDLKGIGYVKACKIKAAFELGRRLNRVVHNHPSGDPKPSVEDKKITDRLRDAGEIIGIRLLDHLIIGYDDYTSFKEIGLL